MPHFVIDCSHSVLNLTTAEKLMQAVFEAAESTNLFAASGVGGIKVRLNPYRHYLNVDSHEYFVHVFVNIMEGRDQDQKKRLSEKVVRSISELLPTVEIISINIRDFEKASYFNKTLLEDGNNSL